MSLALALDTDAAIGLVDDGLTDGETEASTLYEVVELDETLEDGSLLLLGNTCTCVFAIEVETIIFWSPANTDVPLVGVLDGIGNEIGEDLLQSSLVDIG